MIQIYYNSENSDYFLQINDDSAQRTAEVYDKLNRKIHHFEITPLQEKNGLIYEYKYIDSDKLPDENLKDSGIEFETKIKMDDKYYRFVDMNLFRPNESNPFLKADLGLRYTEENQFRAFNLCCLLGFDQWDKIQMEEKFIVVKAKVETASGAIENYRLIDDQVIQFKLRANDK